MSADRTPPFDRAHPFVGRAVVYQPRPKARVEQGVITSVNVESELVAVRYGSDMHSKSTRASDLLFLDGTPVNL